MSSPPPSLTDDVVVIFLKTKSSPIDPYEEYFLSHPIGSSTTITAVAINAHPVIPIFLPVLQHRVVNNDEIEKVVSMGEVYCGDDGHELDEKKYSGIIITSQRAVEALGSALKGSRSTPEKKEKLLRNAKVYVVGPATSAAVTALGFEKQNVLGAQCGNGAVLAEFILYDYNEGRWTGRELGRVKRLPLLFLVGETRRDVIPKTLTSAPEDKRIDVCELVVYETCVVDGFREEFRKAIEVDSVENQNKRENACSTPQRVKWVVVFSPTGADVALEVLNEGRNTFLAAIGPTTEKHLENTLARRPDVVAGMPTPEGLWRAIDGFMEQLYG